MGGNDDEDVLALYYRKKGHTVRTVLEEAIQEAQEKYLPALQDEVGEANVDCWALVRPRLGCQSETRVMLSLRAIPTPLQAAA
jgi:hypothetical protein